MTAERRLVLDANILTRAVLGHRVRQIIETHFEHATFFAPEVAFADAERHLPMVIRKRGGDDAVVREALETLAAVARNVEVVDPDGYDAHRSAAWHGSSSATPTTGRFSQRRWLWTVRSGQRTTTSSALACRHGRATGSSST